MECPRILNGTILEPDEELEEETDSEEEAELDQMTRTAIDPYDPTQQQRIMRNGQFDQRYGNRQMDYAVQKTRFDRNRHDDASRQAKDEDDDEDEEEEEPKPEVKICIYKTSPQLIQCILCIATPPPRPLLY